MTITRGTPTTDGLLGLPAAPAAITLPAHSAGTRIYVTIGGLWSTISLTGGSLTWVKLGEGSGGEAVAPTNDVGPREWAVFAAECTSGSETPPTLSIVEAVVNSGCAVWVATPYDKTLPYWGHSLIPSSPAVVATYDTNPATTFTGTSPIWSLPARAGDSILCLAVWPTDLGGAIASSVFSASGLTLTRTFGPHTKSGTGDDVAVATHYLAITAGSQLGGVSHSLGVTGLSSAGCAGPLIAVLVRESLTPPTWTLVLIGTTYGAPAAATGFTATLPAHQAGDRLLVLVAGKSETAVLGAVTGFTEVASGTGGTGTLGTDAGQMKWALYAMDATSSAEAFVYPSVGSGFSTYVWAAWSWRTPLGFRDAIGASVGWVTDGDDTSTTTPLEATCAPWTSFEPTQGDAVIGFGATPTDAASALTSATLSCTGLSGGNVNQDLTNYIDNPLATDCSLMWEDWQAFTGTASAGLFASFVPNGGANFAGPLGAIAIREAEVPYVLELATGNELVIHDGTSWIPVRPV